MALVVAVLAGSAGEQILADPKIESVLPTVEGGAVVLGVAPKTDPPLDRDDPPPKIEVVVVLAGLSVVAAAGAPKMDPPPESAFAATEVPPKIDVVDAAVVTAELVVAAAAAVVVGVPKMDPVVGIVPDAAPNKLLPAAAPAAAVVVLPAVVVAVVEAGFPKIDPLVEVAVDPPVVAMTAAAACPKIEAAFALLPASADEVALVLGLVAEDDVTAGDPKMEPPLDVTFPASGLGDPNMVEVFAAEAPNNEAPLPGVVDAPPPPNNDPAAGVVEGVAAPKRLDPAAVVVAVEAPKRDLEGAVVVAAKGLVVVEGSVETAEAALGVPPGAPVALETGVMLREEDAPKSEDAGGGVAVDPEASNVGLAASLPALLTGVEAKDVACCTGLERAAAKRLVEARSGH